MNRTTTGNTSIRRFSGYRQAIGVLGLGVGLLFAQALTPVYAQPGSGPEPPPASGSENNGNGGPVRLARVSVSTGNVTFRNSEQDPWSQAVTNLPLRQGAQVTVGPESHAEIQFDDGSRLRLGPGSVAVLTQLYSDSQGEYSQITLRTGLASLRLTKAPSVYQVDGPLASVDVSGPAKLRIDAENGMRTSVISGSAVVQGSQGKATVGAGSSLTLVSANGPYTVVSLPPPDSFDRWSGNLDVREDGYLRSPDRTYVPSNVAVMSDSFDAYGDWRADPEYGHVWHPRVVEADWRPYHAGHWVFVAPFGWTWVAAEPWGWAPYHYGTWIHRPYGWCWVPGPSTQYWSPAVVSFYQSGENVVWCPLAPAEVVYPATIGIGFRSGNWSLFFGIGAAAVYFPNAYGRCEARPWDTRAINRVTYVNNITTINNFYGRGGAGFAGAGQIRTGNFVPFNARGAAGASVAAVGAFGGKGGYRNLPAGAASAAAFRGGSFVGAGNGSPFAGPSSVRPTAMSMSATRSLQPNASVPSSSLNRQSFSAAAASPAGARQSIANRPPVAAVGRAGIQNPGHPEGRTGAVGVRPNEAASANAARSSAAEAAAQARASLGQPRGQGTSARPSGSFNPSNRTPTPVGSSASSSAQSAREAAARARASVSPSSSSGVRRTTGTGSTGTPGGLFSGRNNTRTRSSSSSSSSGAAATPHVRTQSPSHTSSGGSFSNPGRTTPSASGSTPSHARSSSSPSHSSGGSFGGGGRSSSAGSSSTAPHSSPGKTETPHQSRGGNNDHKEKR